MRGFPGSRGSATGASSASGISGWSGHAREARCAGCKPGALSAGCRERAVAVREDRAEESLAVARVAGAQSAAAPIDGPRLPGARCSRQRREAREPRPTSANTLRLPEPWRSASIRRARSSWRIARPAGVDAHVAKVYQLAAGPASPAIFCDSSPWARLRASGCGTARIASTTAVAGKASPSAGSVMTRRGARRRAAGEARRRGASQGPRGRDGARPSYPRLFNASTVVRLTPLSPEMSSTIARVTSASSLQ